MGDLFRLPQPPTGRFIPLGDLLDQRGLDAMNLPELHEWTEWQYAQGLTEHTVTARVRRIEKFATMVWDPVRATPDDIVAYLASLPRSLNNSTRATYYSHIRAWFAWLVLTERRDDDPTARVPAPKAPARKPRPVTEEQLLLILGTRMHRRTKMMVLLAAFQGLRVHEIAKVRGEDFDYTAGQLRVVGKGRVDRTLPLHPLVAAFAETFPKRGYWFPAQDEKRGHIHGRSVSDIVGQVLRRAGIPTGSAHRLRHTYATMLVRNGENLRVIQELLRHASLQTTQIYTGVTFDQQRDALNRLGVPEGPTEAA